jgi:hypothetical protein
MKYADADIQEMEEFFSTTELPKSIRLGAGTVITDVPSFIDSHLTIIKLKKGVSLFEPFYDRLVIAKQKITAGEVE